MYATQVERNSPLAPNTLSSFLLRRANRQKLWGGFFRVQIPVSFLMPCYHEW
jgi:hypothetical protein